MTKDEGQKLRDWVRKPTGTAVLAALACGFLVHLFGLVNILHNYDNIDQQPRGYGTGISSGRWLLSLLGDLAHKLNGDYNLSVVNGVLFLLLVACAAAFLVHTFAIRSRWMGALMGMLMVVFPPAFSTLMFRYTSVYYGIGILLAVMAAWILERHRLGLLFSALLTACSLGIYQAYAPITISIFVLLLIQQTLSASADIKSLFLRGLRCCGALVLGLVLYFLFLKICLMLYKTQLSGYQGVDQMGKLTLPELFKQIRLAYYMFLKTPYRDFWGLVNTPLLKGLYLLAQCISAGMILRLLLRYVRSWLSALAVGVLCMVFPAAVGFVMVMCPQSDVYTLMMYAYVLVPCTPIVLLTCFPEEGDGVRRQWLRRGIGGVLALMIFSYGYQTNVNYTAMYYTARQMENYMSSFVSQVRMTEGFTAQKKWAVLGIIDDPLLRDFWRYEVDYGGAESTNGLLKRASWSSWLRNYCGYLPPQASEEELAALATTEEVRRMPCWPDAGSIQVIGDTVVIKFSEAE